MKPRLLSLATAALVVLTPINPLLVRPAAADGGGVLSALPLGSVLGITQDVEDATTLDVSVPIVVNPLALRSLLNSAFESHEAVALNLGGVSITSRPVVFDLRRDGFTYAGGGDDPVTIDVFDPIGDMSPATTRVTASFSTAGRSWLIEPTAIAGTHRLREVRGEDIRNGTAEAAAPSVAAESGDWSTQSLTTGSGPNIDVAVLLTQAGAAANPNIYANLREAAALGTADNSNSGIAGRFNLLAIQRTQYVETDRATDATRLRTATTINAEATALATRTGADVVLLIGTGYHPEISCGQASGIMNATNRSTFANSAFAVVDSSFGCVISNQTFIHEIGHLASLRHDWGHDNTASLHTYGHGFSDTTNNFTDIMGYPTTDAATHACTAACETAPNWSNPYVNFRNHPTGRDQNQTDPAFNALALQDTLPTVAAFRNGVHPFGSFDSATRAPGGARISGWAIDPDTQAAPEIFVHVDSGGTSIGAASLYRPDIDRDFPAYGGSHGYSTIVAMAQGQHNVCVDIVNYPGTAGANQSLGCRLVTIDVLPFGSADAITRTNALTVHIAGWVLDPDVAGATNIRVTGITGGNVTGDTFVANAGRSDIGSAYPDYGSGHGFSKDIIVVGTKSVCIWAQNASGTPGYETFLRSATV